MPERITFTTSDHITIVGDWVTSPTMIGAVLLLHMMPATRQSWAQLQRLLATQGVASLAIDLRGHGESTHDRHNAVLDYRRFTDPEHAASIEDVAGAVQWIRVRGIEPARIAIAGASIGANLALWYLSENPVIPAAALLSPGENYHGISALDAAPNVLPHQSVWMAASSGDDDESVRAVDDIATLIDPEQVTVEKLVSAGHGTHMLQADAALTNRLAEWLRDRILATS